MLEDDVRDAVLDHDLALGRLASVLVPELFLGDDLVAELLAGHFVSPVAKRALGELLDIALVDDGHALALALDGVLQGETHQPLGAERAHRLDAQPAALEEFRAHFLAQKAG